MKTAATPFFNKIIINILIKILKSVDSHDKKNKFINWHLIIMIRILFWYNFSGLPWCPGRWVKPTETSRRKWSYTPGKALYRGVFRGALLGAPPPLDALNTLLAGFIIQYEFKRVYVHWRTVGSYEKSCRNTFQKVTLIFLWKYTDTARTSKSVRISLLWHYMNYLSIPVYTISWSERFGRAWPVPCVSWKQLPPQLFKIYIFFSK